MKVAKNLRRQKFQSPPGHLAGMYIPNVTMATDRKQMTNQPLMRDEQTTLRSIVGKLNWVVQGSRPDLAFDMIELSTKLKKANIGDLTRSIKCIKKLKYDDSNIFFPPLNKLDKWRIIVFSDASHANLSDGTGSMGAHVVFLVELSVYARVLKMPYT